MLFLVSQALAKPGNNANSTPVSSSATKHCNNVYNSFYAGPNKKIETILQEIKKQLIQLQDDINISKGNKTTVKGKIRFFCWALNSAYFPKVLYSLSIYDYMKPIIFALFLLSVHGLLNWNS